MSLSLKDAQTARRLVRKLVELERSQAGMSAAGASTATLDAALEKARANWLRFLAKAKGAP